jgi:uncharacterized protein (UPF0305 family)
VYEISAHGTVFLSYAHEVAPKSTDFSGGNSIKVISKEDAFYSPLTKKQAEHVCAILNAQSREYYNKQKRISKKQQRTK